MQFPSEKEVAALRQQYPQGTRVECRHMEDAHGVPRGCIGVVDFIDDAGQIHCIWENGSTLALIPDVDSFRILGASEK